MALYRRFLWELTQRNFNIVVVFVGRRRFLFGIFVGLLVTVIIQGLLVYLLATNASWPALHHVSYKDDIPKNEYIPEWYDDIGGEDYEIATEDTTVPDGEWGAHHAALLKARVSVHVATDKEVYRPGETLFVRAVVVPMAGDNALESEHPDGSSDPWIPWIREEISMEFTVISAERDIVQESEAMPVSDWQISFQWRIPKDISGGEYTLQVGASGRNIHFPGGERKIQVYKFRSKSLLITVDFLEIGYGPGDHVATKISVARAKGGRPPSGTPVTMVPKIDGSTFLSDAMACQLDEEGECHVDFSLPKFMSEGVGVLTAVVRDGGVVESVSKTIPIVLQALDLKLYPEGGPLVERVENMVYWEALSPTGEPLEVKAELWSTGQNGSLLVCQLAAHHEGRGKFNFTPFPGREYEIHILKPSGVAKAIPLPPAEKEGPGGGEGRTFPLVALSLLEREAGGPQVKPVRVRVEGMTPGKVRVALFWKEVQLESVSVELSGNGESGKMTSEVVLKTERAPSHGGVGRVTVFVEDSKIPIAERLVFLQPRKILHVEVRQASGSAGERAYPGAREALEVVVKDEEGKGVKGAIVGLVVSDRSTGAMVEERKRAPRLIEMVLLEDEVEHLEASGEYLGGTDEDKEAMDLLLGTQGWRRFVYSEPLKNLGVGKRGKTLEVVEEEAAGEESTERRRKFERMMVLALKRSYFRYLSSSFHYCSGSSVSSWRQSSSGEGPEEFFESDALVGPHLDMPEGIEENEKITEVSEDMYFANDKKENGEMDFLKVEDMDFAEDDLHGPPGYQITYDRVYAYRKVENRGKDVRQDFKDTVFWSAALVTDKQGIARAEFDLSDSITSFGARADAHLVSRTKASNRDKPWPLAFGSSSEHIITSGKPLTVDVKAPLELTAGDRVDLPISIANSVSENLRIRLNYSVQGALQNVGVDAGEGTPKAVQANMQIRHFVSLIAKSRLEITNGNVLGSEGIVTKFGQIAVDIEGSFEEGKQGLVLPNLPPLRDAVIRPVLVSPEGFPGEISFGGSIESNQVASGRDFILSESMVNWHIGIPVLKKHSRGLTLISAVALSTAGAIAGEVGQNGSLSMSVVLYPSPLASLAHAIEALIQEPHGCFEQTSATVYPNIMAQLYFKTHKANSETVNRSTKMLKEGFARLQTFEIGGSGGFEWFGQSPASEALTAYALMEFTDLAKVHPVPKPLLQRVAAWLAARRDNSRRSFRLEEAHSDGLSGAPENVTLAYIVWALASAGYTQDIVLQLENVRETAVAGKDPYLQALAAISLYRSGQKEKAKPLADALRLAQRSDGSVHGSVTSITRSTGEELLVETTSLALLTWLEEWEHFKEVGETAVSWIFSQCQGGSYGSTQATVLALKALLAYNDKIRDKTAPNGTATLSVNGDEVATVEIKGRSETPLILQLPESRARNLYEGRRHRMEVSMEGGFSMPYTVQIRYRKIQLMSSPDSAVHLTTELTNTDLAEGDLADIIIRLSNKLDHPLFMSRPMIEFLTGDELDGGREREREQVVAIIGLPGGLEIRHDHLKDLVTSGVLPFYEVRGREVVLYWRTMAPRGSLQLRLQAEAAVPGHFKGQASRAYEYYSPKARHWSAPLHCSIARHGRPRLVPLEDTGSVSANMAASV